MSKCHIVGNHMLQLIIYLSGSEVRNSRYGGSYMSAHVLLNLLNELEKMDKM